MNSGKGDRAPVSEASPPGLTRAQIGLEAPFVAPATGTEQRLAELWQRVLQIEGLGVEDDYFALGGDSVMAVTLFTEIERSFGQLLLPSALLDSPTVRSLAALLDRPSRAAPERPLVAIRAEGARPPLFFAHTITGDALFVRQFLPYLAPDQPLYGFEARGLDGVDRPHRRIEDMAADFAQLIGRVQPRGPYFLAGLCDGSLTALETARILRAAGEEVGFVGLIDPRTNPIESPWLYWRQPDLPRIRLWRQVLRKLLRLKRKVGPLVGWHPAPEAVELPVDGPEMARRRQAIRAGMTEALAAYRPQPYEGEIAIFASAVRVAEIGRRSPGWQALARRCDVITVASNHIQVMAGALPLLASRLRDKLEGAQAAASR